MWVATAVDVMPLVYTRCQIIGNPFTDLFMIVIKPLPETGDARDPGHR